MDGFHLANATLDRLGLRDRKGAIETFDGWGFLALLERVRQELDHVVYAPAFERQVDEPVAGEIAIEASARFVVVEGNYLLADAEPWRRVRGLVDEAWFCETDDLERTSRLVRRHTEFGRSPEAARAWATEVDGANAGASNRHGTGRTSSCRASHGRSSPTARSDPIRLSLPCGRCRTGRP